MTKIKGAALSRINTHLTRAQLDGLAKYAEKTGRDRADLIRVALDLFLSDADRILAVDIQWWRRLKKLRKEFKYDQRNQRNKSNKSSR